MPNVKNRSDVIIIGGGIVGVAAAYFLVNDGIKVTVFDKDSIAAHASGFAAGVLLPKIGNDQTRSGPITNSSLNLHRELSERIPYESGITYGYKEKPALLIGTGENDFLKKEGLLANENPQENENLFEWLDKDQIRRIEPRLSNEVYGGLLVKDVIELDPYSFCLSLWKSAQLNGAKLKTNEVDEIIVEGSRAIGVRISGEPYFSDAVIVAAGPWSGGLLNKCGINIPIVPMKGQIIRLLVDDVDLDTSVWCGGNYATSKPDGNVWCGTTEEFVGFDENPTENARLEIMESITKLLPFLARSKIVKHTACLRPIVMDGIPVLGESTSIGNVVVATGAGRHGITIGPGMGLVTSQLVQGEEPHFDISEMNPKRFEEHEF